MSIKKPHRPVRLFRRSVIFSKKSISNPKFPASALSPFSMFVTTKYEDKEFGCFLILFAVMCFMSNSVGLCTNYGDEAEHGGIAT